MTDPARKLLQSWPIILSQVESVKELGECRLVCKTWDPPAEAEMFRRQLYLTNEGTITKLLYHLRRKPSLSQYIKSLLFGIIDEQHLPLQEEFLCKALTPSIRKLEGVMCNELFNLLWNIGRSRIAHFENLESLPAGTGTNDYYVETVLLFKASLRELTISADLLENDNIKQLIQHLDLFISLTKLNLDFGAMPLSLTFLDMVLKKCSSLEQLELECNSSVDYSEVEWQNVTQVSSLVTLNLGEFFDAQVVQYLVYKYPNISTIIIEPFKARNGCSFGPILDAIKNIDSVYLSMWSLNNFDELESLISKIKSKKNQVRIQQCSSANEAHWIIMNVTKSAYNKSTFFDIEITNQASSEIYAEILVLIGSIDCLEINYLGYNHDNIMIPSFYNVLSVIPEIENLKFADRRITYHYLLLDGLGLNKLTSLELRGATIDLRAMSDLSKVSPGLKHLIFDTCIFDLNSSDIHLSLPHSDLETLSIITTDFDWHSRPDAALKGMKEHISIHEGQVFSLLISALSSLPNQYYILTAGEPCSRRIPVDEFGETFNQLPCISIKCRSLATLNIKLGKLVLQMSFNEEMGGSPLQ